MYKSVSQQQTHNLLRYNAIRNTSLASEQISLMDPAAWLMLVAFLVPLGEVQNYFGEAFSITKIIMLAIMFCSLLYKVVNRQVFYRSVLDVPIILFVASFAMSLLTNDEFYATGLIVVTIAGYFVLNMVICNFVTTGEKILRIVISLIAAVSVASVFGATQFLTSLTFLDSVLGRSKLYYAGQSMVLLGTESNPNAFGLYFAIAIPLILALFFLARRRIVKFVLVALIVLFSIVLLWTLARGAMLGTIAGSGTVVILLMRKRRKLAAILFIVIILVSAFLNIWWKFNPEYSPSAFFGSRSFYSIRDKMYSIEIRVRLYKANMLLFLDHPVLGVGFDRSRDYVCEYGSMEPLGPHNNFLGIASELGLVGLVPFVLIIVITARKALRAISQTKDPLMFYLLLGLLGAYASLHTIGMTHMNYVNVSLWLITGLLIAGSEIVRKQESSNI